MKTLKVMRKVRHFFFLSITITYKRENGIIMEYTLSYQGILAAQIPLTLSHHWSLLVIAHVKSSRWHPLSTQMMNVRFYWSTNHSVSICRCSLENITYEFVLTSPACLILLTWMVCVIEG